MSEASGTHAVDHVSGARHRFKCNACVYCGMRFHWPGAKLPCDAFMVAKREKSTRRTRALTAKARREMAL